MHKKEKKRKEKRGRSPARECLSRGLHGETYLLQRPVAPPGRRASVQTRPHEVGLVWQSAGDDPNRRADGRTGRAGCLTALSYSRRRVGWPSIGVSWDLRPALERATRSKLEREVMGWWESCEAWLEMEQEISSKQNVAGTGRRRGQNGAGSGCGKALETSDLLRSLVCCESS